MKKFFVTLIILCMVGSTVFFVGWITYLIEPDHYVVVFSKTSGWDEQTIHPGEFAWYWERLLPTNMNIFQYQLNTVQSTIHIKKSLPSASHYAQYLDGTPEFTYTLNLKAEWIVDPDKLPVLAQSRGILPDDMPGLIASLEHEVSNTIEHKLLQCIQDETDRLDDTPSTFIYNLSSGLADEVSDAMENVKIRAVTLVQFDFPDLQLYQAGRNLYAEMIESRRNAIQQANAASIYEELITEKQMEALKTYGQIITEYPLLLEYFTLSAQNDTDPLRLNRMGELFDDTGVLFQ